MKIDTMTSAQFAALFDHSLLRPENTRADFARHIQECRQYGFYSAAINTSHAVSYTHLDVYKRQSLAGSSSVSQIITR